MTCSFLPVATLPHPPPTPAISPWILGGPGWEQHPQPLTACPSFCSGVWQTWKPPLTGLGGDAVLHPAPSGGDTQGDHTGWSTDRTCVILAPHPHTDGVGRQEGEAEGHPCPASCHQKMQAGRGDRSLHRQTQLQLASASIWARRSLGIILSFFANDLRVKKKNCFSRK